ncbi:hypothetical protein AT1G44740 [Arabidopsis thaliana]|uniref:Uncharacterized protein n=1 Tax=Arabidopsis thaliana TaxID=3702 RepID=F4IEH1_ARATH|nr:uncharacterized protein AT1G44740 [Arabidopsis thaliana]AEE32043.1 hypothetical protein AT1G44740 [Arabidopsis thaliana]|eukprot:NP_175095.1 hypothetical protein AT1G44740 [Arabidopsis thaliana]
MVIRRIKRFLGLKPGNQRRKQVIRVLTMTEEGEINVLSIKEEGEINVLSTKEEGGAKMEAKYKTKKLWDEIVGVRLYDLLPSVNGEDDIQPNPIRWEKHRDVINNTRLAKRNRETDLGQGEVDSFKLHNSIKFSCGSKMRRRRYNVSTCGGASLAIDDVRDAVRQVSVFQGVVPLGYEQRLGQKPRQEIREELKMQQKGKEENKSRRRQAMAPPVLESIVERGFSILEPESVFYQKKVLAIKGNGAYTFVADSTLGSVQVLKIVGEKLMKTSWNFTVNPSDVSKSGVWRNLTTPEGSEDIVYAAATELYAM